MRELLFFLIFFVQSSVWCQDALDLQVQSYFVKYQRARVELLSRVDSFNSLEAELKGLENIFDSTVNHLRAELMKPERKVSWRAEEQTQLVQGHLERDYKKYQKILKSKLLESYKKTKISRSIWEQWLDESPESLYPLQQKLAKRFDKIQQEQRLAAQKESQLLNIDLRELSQNIPRVQQFCRELPKGGMLHTHPYGTMDRATVRHVLSFFNPQIHKNQLLQFIDQKPEKIHISELQFLNQRSDFYSLPKSYHEVLASYPQDAKAIENLFFMPPASAGLYDSHFTPFARFLGAFAAPLELLGVLSGRIDVQMELERILYDQFFIRNLQQNVGYAELTRNLPVLLQSKKIEDRYQALNQWTEDIEQRAEQGFYAKTLYSFNRTNLESEEKQLQQVEMMTQLLALEKNSSIVGINLMGDETERDALGTSQFIYGKLLRSTPQEDFSSFHIKPTMHAGELGDLRNVRDAMIFGVRRLGHAVLMAQNPLYIEYARQQSVSVEANLTSNQILGVVSVAKNPFLFFHRLGIPVSLSTDDEGIFETDMNTECALAVVETDIEYSELKQMMLRSLETSFADRLTRERLLEKLKQDFVKFEQRWSSL